MMKTLRLRRVLLLLLIACAILALASCDNSHTHTPGDWIVDTDATCTEEGEKHTECTDCGEVIDTKSIPKKGHSYVDGVCSACDAIDPELGADPSCEHDFVTHKAKAPTCTEIGWNEYVICSRCNHTTYKEKSALGHDYQLGVCSRCGSKEQEGSKGLEFTSNGDGTCYVSGIGNCSDIDLIIPPKSPNGEVVVAIGEYAFMKNYNLTTTGNFINLRSVVIPDSVKIIGYAAFAGCSDLISVDIPYGLEDIRAGAFMSCTNLQDISIPNTITKVGLDAFYYCVNLKVAAEDGNAAYLGNSENPYLVLVEAVANPYQESESIIVNPKTKCIADGAFKSAGSFLDIIISSGVTEMSGLAFVECNDFDSVIIDESNPRYVVTDGNIYSKDGKTLVRYFSKDNEVAIPSGVTCIADGAFSGDWHLDKINIPLQVTSIGNFAFYDCRSLVDVTVPSSVTDIGDYTFHGCSYIKSITLPSGITSIGVGAFIGCGIVNITIPEGVTNIGSSAFADCWYLESIVLPRNITRIGDMGFYQCPSLTNMTIPDSVTFIGNSAFAYCYKLTDLNIPVGVTSIRDFAFYSCSSLEYIIIPDGIERIGIMAFVGCSSLKSINIPSKVTSIGYGAFSGCSSLSSIVVDDSNTEYKSIDGDLYTEDGRKLIKYAVGKTETNFAVPNCVTIIEAGAFSEDDTLANITIPDGVTSIGDSAFAYCRSLTSITIGNGVTSIGSHAFSSCSSLTSITIPDSVTSIGDYAFSSCSSLTSITIPDSVTSIGDYAFRGCSSLTSINIPDSVTSIGDFAFSSCESLTSITIDSDNTVYKSIDGNLYTKDGKTLIQYAIGKTAISFTIPDGVTSIGYGAFYNCSSLKSITIPDSVTSIGYGAFYNCSSLKSITIPDSVTSIGYGAFYDCSLSSVTFENTTDWWYSSTSGAPGGTTIPSSDLADPTKAAEYLNSTYSHYYWHRS